jgi:diguanylate cyclase (GGDEF)-like protein/PAS domain S-box-containing protein
MTSRPTATPDGDWSATSALEARDRQLQVWRVVLQARYVAIAALAVATVLPRGDGPNGWVAGLITLVVLPYNALHDLFLRRRGQLLPTIAIADQVLGVAVLAIDPGLLTPVLVVLVVDNATNAVAFGRRLAAQAASLGVLGTATVAAILRLPDSLVPLLVFVGSSVFVVFVVGLMSENERRLRWRYAELMGGIDGIVWEQLTQRPSTLYVNRRAEEVLGYPTIEWRQPGFWRAHVHPDDIDEAARHYRDAIRRGRSAELEYRMLAADGRVVFVHDRMRVETDEFGRARHVRGIMLDVTAEKQARAQADLLIDLVDSIRHALFVFGLVDPDDDQSLQILAMNPEAEVVAGLRADQCTGQLVLDVMRVPDVDLVIGSLADVIRSGEPWSVDDFRVEARSPSARIYAASAFPLPGDTVGLSLQDITERAMAAEVLRKQALHDGLTGLPNRTLLTERLRLALRSSQVTGEPAALLVMDLDQFKDVNDALGHDHGDRLLIEMSRRLQHVLREADTLARLGGDEFAVLLTSGADVANATATARHIRDALADPFQLGGIFLQSNASIGIAVYPDHATDAETLVQRADVAMYTAKRGGLGHAVYAPEQDQSSVHRLALLGELRRAIAKDELVVHYQPCLDLRTGTVSGAEALVRWDHPTHGLMAPSEFIELAEVSGAIGALTRWVIGAAIEQATRWQRAGWRLPVAVNLSVRNLYDRELVPWLSDCLATRGIDASLLTLEVTESELMDDPILAMEVLGKVKALGASTAIDDFGTGYSSLAYLKHLPIDELKIDRSFVSTMVADESDLTIVRSTIDLSHNLGLDVVAEGVEDAPTLVRLAELGCDRVQGYFVSRPVPADVLEAWANDDSNRSAVQEALAQVTPAASRAQVMQYGGFE